jgi:hypothetical protein
MHAFLAALFPALAFRVLGGDNDPRGHSFQSSAEEDNRSPFNS